MKTKKSGGGVHTMPHITLSSKECAYIMAMGMKIILTMALSLTLPMHGGGNSLSDLMLNKALSASPFCVVIGISSILNRSF